MAIHTNTSYKREGKRGFTIVETLVAISILIIALTGPLAIIASSLKSSYFSRDEITAAYLAQEPIEYIRNLRDQNALRSPDSSTWLRGISASDDGFNTSFMNNARANLLKLNLVWQTSHYALKVCPNSGCEVTYDPDAGTNGDSNKVAYGVDSTSNPLPPALIKSIYTRDIYLNAIDSDPSLQREIVITVVVSWHTGSVSHNVTVSEHLFNWELENQS
jgi:type II secretory pathway pseudopilin PulG